MTTVTEAAKRLLGVVDEEALQGGDLGRLCGDALLAQQLARRIAVATQELAPGRHWSIEDIRDVFEVACRGPQRDSVQILEGRFFRKRLREQCALSERYGDPFALMVVKLVNTGDGSTFYDGILDGITSRLRRTDMVFLYKHRFGVILPRMRAISLGPLIGRVEKLIAIESGVGEDPVDSVATLVYPDPQYCDTQSVLDWVEDQLREI